MSLHSSFMKQEVGLTPPTGGGSDPATRVEVKLVHTFRLEEKWEKLCANVTAKILEAMLEPAKVLVYSLAASMILLATAKVIQAIRSSKPSSKD
mmetsp:Transcript_9098/g.12090  ORF Transcript_9098/g.12090 Transcript_9098/m.12090 type:complete len:94 (-) Transcript_9098:217-498(-)